MKNIQFEVTARGPKQDIAKIQKNPCLMCINATQSYLGPLLERQPGPSDDNNASDDDNEYLEEREGLKGGIRQLGQCQFAAQDNDDEDIYGDEN